MNMFVSSDPFDLEGGETLEGITIAYHTYGELAASGSNVIWICRPTLRETVMSALGESDLIGPGLVIDTDRYFVARANVIGSCYGSTEPTHSDFRPDHHS
jgi:homoserine O-acetyltransferase